MLRWVAHSLTESFTNQNLGSGDLKKDNSVEKELTSISIVMINICSLKKARINNVNVEKHEMYASGVKINL